MSKAGALRPRHIAFLVEAPRPPSRHILAQALAEAAKAAGLPTDAVRLTRYAFPHGIASTDHRHQAAVRQALSAGRPQGLRLVPLSTSGTILTLTQRLGILQERGPRPAQAKGPGARATRQAPKRQGAAKGRDPHGRDPASRAKNT